MVSISELVPKGTYNVVMDQLQCIHCFGIVRALLLIAFERFLWDVTSVVDGFGKLLDAYMY
jgi:hypothetical protein